MISTVGILGLGSIGQRHARNLMQLGIQVFTYDPNDPRTMSQEEVLKNSEAVMICSPTKWHFPQMMDANDAGVRAIFVEKPIAYDAHPEMVRGFVMGLQAKGVFLATGYNLRFHSAVKRMKEIIQKGELGAIQWADFCVGQTTQKGAYLRDGVTLNWSHETDLALHLLGPADLKAADVADEDYRSKLLLKHEHGVSSSVHLDYTTEPEIRSGVIVGDKRRIHYDLLARTIRIVSRDGSEAIETFTDTWDQNYMDELTTFLACAEGYPSATIATGYDGYHTYKISYEALDEARNGA